MAFAPWLKLLRSFPSGYGQICRECLSVFWVSAIVVTFLITVAKHSTRSNLKEKQILFQLAVRESGPSKQGSSSMRVVLAGRSLGALFTLNS